MAGSSVVGLRCVARRSALTKVDQESGVPQLPMRPGARCEARNRKLGRRIAGAVRGAALTMHRPLARSRAAGDAARAAGRRASSAHAVPRAGRITRYRARARAALARYVRSLARRLGLVDRLLRAPASRDALEDSAHELRQDGL